MKKKAGNIIALDTIDAPYDPFKQTQKYDNPLYKLKMFQDVVSKVAEEVRLFKVYHPYKKKKKVDDGMII